LDQFFSYRALERLAGEIGKGFLKVPEQKLLQIYLFLNWYHLFVEKDFQRIAAPQSLPHGQAGAR